MLTYVNYVHILRNIVIHIDKGDDVKDSFYLELGHVFDQLPRYNMKILLGDFNVKVAGKIFSNQQSEMRVYMKLVMTMELD
jgi:hypothetical protein